MAEFFRQVTEEVEAVPGVISVGATMVDPFRGPRPSNRVAVDPAQDLGEFVRCQFRIGDPDLLKAEFRAPLPDACSQLSQLLRRQFHCSQRGSDV